MPSKQLTPNRVRAVNPKRHSYTIHDNVRKGLCLRVAPSGRKTFEFNVMRKGVRHKQTIGDANVMPLLDARLLYDKRLAEIDALNDIGPETPFEAMAELTMQRKERIWKPSTYHIRRCYLNNTILPFFRGRTIGSVSRRDVEEFFAGLRSKSGAANYCVPFLSVIMREAEAMGARPEDSNPVQGVRRYKRTCKERVLTPEEMARLGAVLEAHGKKQPMKTAIIRLIILTGCRKNEIINLHWNDYRNGHLYLRDSKSGPKTVFLSSHARKVLDGVTIRRPGPIFPNGTGKGRGIYVDYFWRIMRREAGLNDVNLHDLRHNYATTAIKLGVNLKIVGALLGHNNDNSTLRYTHLDNGMMLDAADLISRAMASGKGEAE